MFEQILGHDNEKKILEKTLKNNNISHAYLFSGKKGIGKATLAFEFAKQILHTDNLINCPDYKYICKKEDKKDIVIEQIRSELIDDIYICPIIGDKKVYIIDDAQCLNIASQNALLKTLEEPPKYVVVILISTNISTFLPTIISRVSIINFNTVEDILIKKYINDKLNISLNDNVLEYIDGSIGLAIEISKDELLSKYGDVDKLCKSIINKDVVKCLSISQDIDFNNDNMLNYLEHLLYITKEYQSIKFIENAKRRLKYNGNYDIVIDNMLLKIIDSI